MVIQGGDVHTLLDPTDPLLVEIGKAFILQQIEGI